MKHLLTALLIAICALGKSQTTADADINGDGIVAVNDVLFVLGEFGAIVPPQYCDAPCVDCELLWSEYVVPSGCYASGFDVDFLYDYGCHDRVTVEYVVDENGELNGCEPLIIGLIDGFFEGQRLFIDFPPVPPGCIDGIMFEHWYGASVLPYVWGCFQGDQSFEFRWCDNEWHYVE